MSPRSRLALVTAGSLALFGLSNATLSFPVKTKTETRTVYVSSPSAVPSGEITRADCARLEGQSFAAIVHRYGMPADMRVQNSFFDSLHYPLVGDEGKKCNVYFEVDDSVDDYHNATPVTFIVRNVSVDI